MIIVLSQDGAVVDGDTGCSINGIECVYDPASSCLGKIPASVAGILSKQDLIFLNMHYCLMWQKHTTSST